jgi:hypothetical protein
MMFRWWFFTLEMFHYFLLSHEGEVIHIVITHVDILENLVLGFF